MAGGEVAGDEAGDMIAVMARGKGKKIGGSRAYSLAVPGVPGVPGMRCPDNQLLLWIPFQGAGPSPLEPERGNQGVF